MRAGDVPKTWPAQVAPFPIYELQARWVAALLTGRAKLPSEVGVPCCCCCCCCCCWGCKLGLISSLNMPAASMCVRPAQVDL